jgi:hypothetical protein
MKSRGKKIRERGMALVITMILLSLLGAASLAMIMYVSSDTMINSYYRNYRGSFYAADSGVNIIVQSMKTALTNAATPLANGSPLPTGAIPAAVTTAIAPYQNSFYMVGDPNSWNGQFELVANQPVNGVTPPVLGAPSYVATPNASDPNSPGNGDVIYTYSYPYTITVQGQSAGSESELIVATGTITYSSGPGTGAAGSNPRFSNFGAFITNFNDCQGPLVPGTMTGPFFTDGNWNFGNNSSPGYTFTDSVGQAGANVSWWNGNNCTDSPTAPKGFKQPTFQNGLNLGQTPIVPPSDTYSQAQAVLDAKGIPPCTASPCPTDPPPTQATMNAMLKTVNGTAFPATGTAPNGVYIPYYTNNTNCKTHPCYGSDPSQGGDGAGGGFYIQGDASVTLTASGTTSHPTQTYTITQGSTTTTIVVDPAGTTTVTSGSSTQVLTGAPQQLDPTTGAPPTQPMVDPSGNPVSATMVYVNGNITGLKGTVQNDTGITVAASTSVSITGDLTYMQSPVSIPSDTLTAGTDAGVLGVYTTGNINLYPNSSGSNAGNLTVNASLAALSGQTGSSANSGFETPGNSIGTWQIVGGRAEDHAHSVSISQGNTYFDRRFTNTFGPPWFPTAVPQPGSGGVPASGPTLTVTRRSWQEVRP